MFMNWLRTVRSRLQALFLKQELDAQMDAEMRSHIEMQTQENIDAGMKPEEARYAALHQFGWIESIKETCREQRGVNWIENFGQDIRYGGRILLKNPGYTVAAVLTLALGIGANTAMFSIINAVLLRPLPFSDPHRLVMVWQEFPKRGSARESFSLPNFIDLRRETKLFADAGSFSLSSHTLTGVDEPERLNSIRMSAGLIPTPGVRLALGRNFREEEDRPDADRVALLSDHLWRRRFGSNPGIIGRTMGINDEAVTIVGVLPKTFRIGEENPDICVPLRLDPAKVDRGQRGLQAIARLKPGVKVRQVQPELNVIAARLRSADPSGTAIEGRTFAPNQYPFAHIRCVGGNYFQTLRVPLLDGRHFTEADNETAQKVVVINATMARQFWAQESAIGKRIRPDGLQEKAWLTIVGVVADIKNESLAQPPRPEIYYLYAQYPTRGLGVMLRTSVPPNTLAETVRREIWTMDSSLAITSTQTMEQVMRQSSSTTSFQSLLLGIFAGLALLLAAIGIHSVLSCAVGQRSREIGIRMALGARTASVYALILSGGMKSVLMGIGIGLVAAIFSTRFIARLLFETSATDSVTLISVALLLASTALAACFFPARRAAKVDPMVALRHE